MLVAMLAGLAMFDIVPSDFASDITCEIFGTLTHEIGPSSRYMTCLKL